MMLESTVSPIETHAIIAVAMLIGSPIQPINPITRMLGNKFGTSDIRPIGSRRKAYHIMLVIPMVETKKLDAVKNNLRYSFATSMDNSEAIAGALANAVALRRTPETLNRMAEIYESITPEDIRDVARKYFTENNRTIVTLTGAAK